MLQEKVAGLFILPNPVLWIQSQWEGLTNKQSKGADHHISCLIKILRQARGIQH